MVMMKSSNKSKKYLKGDVVKVIAGKDKGKTGKLLTVYANGKLLVEGVGLKIKHAKPNPQLGQDGGRISSESPIHHSNVMLVNPVTGLPDRVGFKMLPQESGELIKVRYCKSNGEILASVQRG